MIFSLGPTSVVPTIYSCTSFCLSNYTSKDAEFHALSEYIIFFGSTYFYNHNNVGKYTKKAKKCILDTSEDYGVFIVL
jgi:hypothetical protein